MKVVLAFLAGVIVLSLVLYTVPSYRKQIVRLLSYSECDTPLAYTLGTIDPRFGLSRDEALSDITNATAIWSAAEGKSIFTYSPDAKLTVNFVYDQRQALDTTISQLNSKLKQSSSVLSQQIADYKAQVASFQQRLSAFNAIVDRYNREGGAPESVYRDLLSQQKQLNAEADTLNERAKQLDLSTIDYNAGVSALNKDINQFQNALALKPEDGIYNGADTTITIYFADNQSELVHTLAHEFGHALGMEHVKDPQAIMYPYTTGSLQVTADDMKQLTYVCREQSAIIHDLQQFDIWLISEIQNLKQNIVK